VTRRPDITELPVPPEALAAGGTEICRAFIVGTDLNVSLQRAFDEPEVWGVLLSDIARHAAYAFVREDGLREEDVLDRMKNALDSAWDRPGESRTTARN
jgi:hypothetical protein